MTGTPRFKILENEVHMTSYDSKLENIHPFLLRIGRKRLNKPESLRTPKMKISQKRLVLPLEMFAKIQSGEPSCLSDETACRSKLGLTCYLSFSLPLGVLEVESENNKIASPKNEKPKTRIELDTSEMKMD